MSRPTHKPKYINDADMADTIEGDWLLIDQFDNIGFHLVWDDEGTSRSITHDADDAVVAGTGVWRFDNGAFTAADLGGTLTKALSTNAGNNGNFTILEVVDATHVRTATTGLVNETFGSDDTQSVQQSAPVGAFSVEVTQDGFDDRTNPAPNGHLEPIPLSLPEDWADFYPGAAADDGKFKMSLNQLDDKWIRLVYEPVSGGGKLRVGFGAKGL
jgi:hypothetical protein